jgi:alkylhydroperoxidase family enzyme
MDQFAPVSGRANGSTDIARIGLLAPVVAWRSFHASLRTHASFPTALATPSLARLRRLLGLPSGQMGPVPAAEPAAGPVDYAEQFLIDANGIDRALGLPLKASLGDAGLVVYTLWLGVVESELRLEALLGPDALELGSAMQVLPEPSGRYRPSSDPADHPWSASADRPAPTLQELTERVAPEVATARAAVGQSFAGVLSPRTTELIRLTSANAVTCRYCQNVRYSDGEHRPLVDEIEVAGLVLGNASAQDPQEALGLAAARAFFVAPGPPDRDIVASLQAQPLELQAELLTSLMRFPAGSKAMIALGLVPDETPLTLL